jgi:hypothetical protein
MELYVISPKRSNQPALCGRAVRFFASRWSTGVGPGADAEVSRAGRGSNDDPSWYSRATRSPFVRRCGACRRTSGQVHAQIFCTYWHGVQKLKE